MTTNTISTLAKRTETELAEMIAKSQDWIASIGTPRERSESDLAMARDTISAIGRERRRRHEEIWNIQSTRSPGERTAAAFAHRPLDRHERRLLLTLLEESGRAPKASRADASSLASIVSARAAFFGPPVDDAEQSPTGMLHLVERTEDDGSRRLRLRDDVRDAVAQAVRDHDIEIERRRRMKAR